MIQLPDPPLLLITDRTMVRVSLEAALERAFAGNCRWVMVREKDLDETARLSLVESVMQIAEPFGAKVVVNSDLKAGAIADGVHLPQGQSCTNARTVLGPDKIIGVSAHTIGEAAIRVVTAGTGQAAVSRQHRIKEQVAAQVGLSRRKPVAMFRQTGFQAANTGTLQRVIQLVQGTKFAVPTGQLKARRTVFAQHHCLARDREGRNQYQQQGQ